jgi:hypothetical protein
MSKPFPEPRDPDGILRQYPLRNSKKTYHYQEKLLNLGFTIQDGFFTVYYEVKTNSDLSIDVVENTKVRISLIQPGGKAVWRWSTQFQAITRKRTPVDRQHYKNLRYIEPDGSETPWMQDMNGNYDTVTFIAKKGKHREEAHGFSMNVDFKAPGENDFWLPVTIDPDIINPRIPGAAFFVAALKLAERDDVVGQPLFAFAPDPEAENDECKDYDDDGKDAPKKA